MVFIRTHDGRVGWEVNGVIQWFNTDYQAKMWGEVQYDFDMSEIAEFQREFDRMMDHLSKTGDTRAHFGVYGTFMYSEPTSV